MAGRNVEFISLPVGFEKFHHQAFLNYQFNRAYGLGLADRNDLYEAGLRVRSAADCVIAFETGTASQVNHDAALRCEPVLDGELPHQWWVVDAATRVKICGVGRPLCVRFFAVR